MHLEGQFHRRNKEPQYLKGELKFLSPTLFRGTMSVGLENKLDIKGALVENRMTFIFDEQYTNIVFDTTRVENYCSGEWRMLPYKITYDTNHNLFLAQIDATQAGIRNFCEFELYND